MKNENIYVIRTKKELREYIQADTYVNFGRNFTLKKKLGDDKFKLLFFLRFTHYYFYKKKKNPLERLLLSLSNSFYNRYKKKLCIDLKPKTRIGKGLKIPHPLGIVINAKSTIGHNCTIMQQVTIGNRSENRPDAVPVIEDYAYLGAGCKILGECRIGANAKVGANAVVLDNVPPNSIALGIPAQTKKAHP